MRYKARKTTCACGGELRPAGRYCHKCHAARQRQYRAEARDKGVVHKGVYADALRDAKRKILLRAVRKHDGNLSAAAIALGIHRNTVARIMREAGLSASDLERHERSSEERAA